MSLVPEPESDWKTRLRTPGLIAAQFLACLLLGDAGFNRFMGWHLSDLSLYARTGSAVLGGQLPYRDFPLEYPPLALLPFTLPLLAGMDVPPTLGTYSIHFLVESALWSSGIALCLARLSARHRFGTKPGTALWRYLAMFCVGALLFPWRYDLFPALLTILALLFVLEGRPGPAGLCLGLGAAAKLYPVLLLPPFLLFYGVSRAWKPALKLALGGLVGFVACFLPLLGMSWWHLFSFLRYHQARGLQIESLPAGALELFSRLGGPPAAIVYNFGSLNLLSPAAGTLLRCLPLLFAVVFGLTAWGCLRQFQFEQRREGRVTDTTLAAFAVAFILAFILPNKVFSPQYLIWLLPFVPLLGRSHVVFYLVVLTLTMLIFPVLYHRLEELETLPVVLLNIRNLLLIVWFCRLCSPQAGERRLERE